jgi:hypothetical protein
MDHPNVRHMLACPKCSQPKDRGLLLCWPCHRTEKRNNEGGYSEATMRLLDAHESEAA